MEKLFRYRNVVYSVIWFIFWLAFAIVNPFNIDSDTIIDICGIIGLAPFVIIPIILIPLFILKTSIKKISKFDDYFFDSDTEEDKEKFIRDQRIRKIRIWKIKKVLKKITKTLFKFLGYILLFFIICLFADYSYDSDSISFWFVILMFCCILINYYQNKDRYNYCKDLGKTDEFYKRFCNEWKPKIIYDLVLFWLGLKYGNAIILFACVSLGYFIDLWDRRFISSDIKQDLILEKLNRKKL